MRLFFLVILSFTVCLNGYSFAGNQSNQNDEQNAPESNPVTDSLWKVVYQYENKCNEPCPDDTLQIEAYIKLGLEYYKQYPDSALTLWNTAEQKAEAFLDANPSGDPVIKTIRFLLAWTLNNTAYIHRNQGDIIKALEYYHKSLEIREEINDKQGMAASFNNIGTIYDNQKEYAKALEYYNKSLAIKEEVGDKQGVARTLNNIGVIYIYQDSTAKAIDYWEKSLKIKEEINDEDGMAAIYANIGSVYNTQNNLYKALEYHVKGLEIYEKIKNKHGIAKTLLSLSLISQKQNDLKKHQKYSQRAYQISKEIGFPELIESAASQMKHLSISQGNYKKAYEYYHEEMIMRDSIQNERNYKETQKREARYEYEKQKVADSIAHAKAMEIKNLELEKSEQEKEKQKAENARQQTIILAFVIGLVVIVFFSIFLYRMFLQKKNANIQLALQNEEINQKNEEITCQRDEIEEQKDRIEQLYNVALERKNIVEEQKNAIEDSILYARKIQSAVLPSQKYASSILGEHFILYRPKDVVSGDFYWTTKVNEWLVVTVADCTGHGVPGAFMSMLGVSFLNEIVRRKEISNAAQILNELRISVIDALDQKNAEVDPITGLVSVRDGMDISLAAINTKTLFCSWAGAYNSLCLFRGSDNELDNHGGTPSIESGKLVEIKGDKMPVAIHTKMDDFTNHEIQLDKDDKLYLFSDGFHDQFGGLHDKKFNSARFKELILKTTVFSMPEQGQQMEKAFNEWINPESPELLPEGAADNQDGNIYTQIDDVTVVGLKV